MLLNSVMDFLYPLAFVVWILGLQRNNKLAIQKQLNIKKGEQIALLFLCLIAL